MSERTPKGPGPVLPPIPRRKQKKLKPIVYLSSAIINLNDNDKRPTSGALDYFVNIISNLSSNLQSSELIKSDLILKIPANNITGEEQGRLLEYLLEKKGSYSAIVIAPLEVSFIEKVLEKRIRSLEEYKKCPIFFIDKFIRAENVREGKKINNLTYPFVTADWHLGGKLAAKYVAENLLKKDTLTNILILKGLEGSMERIDGFVQHFNTLHPRPLVDITIAPENGLNFTTEEALNFCLDFLEKNPTDVIFCCNDAMALGAREAVLQLKKLPAFKKIRNVKIIGFDGIEEFKKLAKNGGSNLVATIDVLLQKQISHLVDQLQHVLIDQDHLEHDALKKLIPPKLWIPNESQQRFVSRN